MALPSDELKALVSYFEVLREIAQSPDTDDAETEL